MAHTLDGELLLDLRSVVSASSSAKIAKLFAAAAAPERTHILKVVGLLSRELRARRSERRHLDSSAQYVHSTGEE